eukprot:EG_transcript_22752
MWLWVVAGLVVGAPPVTAWPSILSGPTAVTINLERYAGTWYEIAASRIPKLTFERGLDCIEAHYTLAKDADSGEPYVKVVNSGINHKTREPTSVTGRALPLEPVTDTGNTLARLAVSFAPGQSKPSSANYIVVYLGGDYQTAVVTDPLRLTLFFLARTPSIPAEEYERMKQAARDNGVWLWAVGLQRTVQDASCGRGAAE